MLSKQKIIPPDGVNPKKWLDDRLKAYNKIEEKLNLKLSL